ncbi:MAG: hypothetical protein AAGF99_10730, partial [Bacteroidota bacterium]
MASFSTPQGYTRTDAASTPRTRTGLSAEGARAKSAPEDPLVEALLQQELSLDDWATYEVEDDASLQRSASARSTSSEPTGNDLTIDVDLAEGEGAIVLIEKDEEYTWVLNPDLTSTPKKRTRGTTDATRSTVQFRVPIEGPGTRSGARGRGGFLPKRLVSFVFKFAARVTAKYAMKVMERHIQPGLVVLSPQRLAKDPPDALFDAEQWTALPNPASLTLPKGRAPKVLLFVHGTFSSTAGSFGALGQTTWGRAVLTEAAKNYDLILGFDHKTMSEDPMDNALLLERGLRSIAWDPKRPAVFDAVAFSRGGLVLRSLIERVLPGTTLPLSFKSGILVGATNGGTYLAEPDNWKTFVDFYTNLVQGAAKFLSFIGVAAGPTGILAGLVRALGSFVKYLAIVAVEERAIPGLAAMEPGGEFVTMLNRDNDGQPTPRELAYYAITSDFEYRSSTTRKSGLSE